MQRSPIQSEPTTFIACLDCQVLEPTAAETSGQPKCNATNDGAANGFLRTHLRHHTTRLERRDLELSSEQRWRRQNSTATFAATDGKRLYVVTGSRPSRGEPLLYHLRPGTLQAKESNLAVDEDTIRRALVSALFPYRLSASKFRRFMSTLRDVTDSLSVEELDLVFEANDDPSVGIAHMPRGAYADLARRCAGLFDPWELPRIEQFLASDIREGLLALRVRRELAALDA